MVNWCHAYGIATSYALHVNAKRWRGLCTNGCGQLIMRRNGKYCSLKCQQSTQRLQLVRRLKSGQYPPVKNNAFLRRFLIQTLGEQCKRCGWNERNQITGRVPLEVEHIDGNWQNNSEDNLTLLCPNCHSLTPTFRNLNKGRGRTWRKGGRLVYWKRL